MTKPEMAKTLLKVNSRQSLSESCTESKYPLTDSLQGASVVATVAVGQERLLVMDKDLRVAKRLAASQTRFALDQRAGFLFFVSWLRVFSFRADGPVTGNLMGRCEQRFGVTTQGTFPTDRQQTDTTANTARAILINTAGKVKPPLLNKVGLRQSWMRPGKLRRVSCLNSGALWSGEPTAMQNCKRIPKLYRRCQASWKFPFAGVLSAPTARVTRSCPMQRTESPSLNVFQSKRSI